MRAMMLAGTNAKSTYFSKFNYHYDTPLLLDIQLERNVY